jgi:DNA-binding transcriptional MerR regulator
MIFVMNTQSRYSLAELARVTGVTPRTVRFYIAQGLLPGANETGPGATYDERHLARLRLIRRLQAQHLPLAEIRTRLAELGDDEIATLLEQEAPARSVNEQTSALDYIRGVLGTPRPEPPSPLMRMTASPPVAPAAASIRRALTVPRLMRPAASETEMVSDAAIAMTAEAAAPSAPAPTTEPPTPARSQWARVALTPDIALQVRRPRSRHDNRRLQRLITIARQVLGEEQP